MGYVSEEAKEVKEALEVLKKELAEAPKEIPKTYLMYAKVFVRISLWIVGIVIGIDRAIQKSEK